ncbi:MAG TPA: hypothetical protein VGV64_07055 [Thermoplasmata archaeon]|nr:hypothetical protein [Thermoplasmata archaeon]
MVATYDTADGYPLLVDNGTWAFEHGVWKLILIAGHTPRLHWPAMAYDAFDGYVLLVGDGPRNSTGIEFQSWMYHAGAWTMENLNHTPLRAQPPTNLSGPSMSYDVRDRAIVLVYGVDAQRGCLGFCPFGITYLYRSGHWWGASGTPAPFGLGFATTYDAADGYVLMFGYTSTVMGTYGPSSYPEWAGDSNGTWEFSAGAWTQLHPQTVPPARWLAGLVFDRALGHPVLFGGQAPNGTALNDTWEWNGTNWVAFHPSGAVPPRVAFGALLDSGSVLAFGGITTNTTGTRWGPGLADTWRLEFPRSSLSGARWVPMDLH